MKMISFISGFIFLVILGCSNDSYVKQNLENTDSQDTVIQKEVKPIITGAEQTSVYLPLLKDKNLAVVGNHTSIVGKTHLVDTLLNMNMRVKKIFCPEHGFRGKADAGESIQSDIDSLTGLPIISLYGSHKKPLPEDMEGIDVVVFDIQDVGARFYTYISTMHYVMEACAENNIKLLILDRPNPNGYYVDGPVLDTAFRSFIGMHTIPIVHGMTVGELAKMINGEKWLNNNKICDLTVISCKNYDHTMSYNLPVKPSPNLPNARSVELYPSLCFFEGTTLSIGRGTNMQFQVIGHPDLENVEDAAFSFTPHANEGAKNPKFKNVTCYGYDLRERKPIFQCQHGQLNLDYLIHVYTLFPDKEHFFKTGNSFNLIAGNNTLMQQIKDGKSEEEIRASWQNGIEQFKKTRKKYLLYKDFE